MPDPNSSVPPWMEPCGQHKHHTETCLEANADVYEPDEYRCLHDGCDHHAVYRIKAEQSDGCECVGTARCVEHFLAELESDDPDAPL